MEPGYRLIEKIAVGSRSEVWKAEAPGSLEVAIKIVYDQEWIGRQMQALEPLKRIRHPHLITLHAICVADSRLYVVTELAKESLGDHWRRCQSEGRDVPLSDLLRWIGQVAEAIDHLHDHGAIHSDINPDHILLVRGEAKIAGFGLAREIAPSQRSVRIKAPRTLDYMSPEVRRGELNIHSDQYSLACTYAELRLKRPPLAGRDAHLGDTPDLDPLPPAEQEVLLKALAKQPDQRYADCRAFVEGLQVAVQNH